MPNLPYLHDLLDDARGELSAADAATVEGWLAKLAALPPARWPALTDPWVAAQAICAICTFQTTVAAVEGCFTL